MDQETAPRRDSGALASWATQFQDALSGVAVTDATGAPLTAEAGADDIVNRLKTVRRAGGAVYLVGNGGSAAVCAHIANDLINVAALRALTLHEPAVLTCQANDYGYDTAFRRLVSVMARPDDLVIAISSSGRSANIHGAVASARTAGAGVITLSGFDPGNALRTLGDLNIWLPARDYGLVEIGHLFILHHAAGRMRTEG